MTEKSSTTPKTRRRSEDPCVAQVIKHWLGTHTRNTRRKPRRSSPLQGEAAPWDTGLHGLAELDGAGLRGLVAAQAHDLFFLLCRCHGFLSGLLFHVLTGSSYPG